MIDCFTSEKLYQYLDQHTKDPHPHMATIREDCGRHKWSFMLTTKQQGAFLYSMAVSLRAQKILEIGSFYGHSTLALAASLPKNGKIISIEHNPKFAAKTSQNLEQAGFKDNLEMLIGEAPLELSKLETRHNAGSFDLVFIDADKRNYKLYWERSLRLVRAGGMIICDNVLARGDVLNEQHPIGSHVQAVKTFNDEVMNDRRNFSFIATLGDGMLVTVKQLGDEY